MTNIEKVIKGLEECVGNGNCTKCQYGKEKQALTCKKLLTDALALLKKQGAIRPTIDAFGHPYCPKCKILVSETWKFCPHCGQTVK